MNWKFHPGDGFGDGILYLDGPQTSLTGPDLNKVLEITHWINFGLSMIFMTVALIAYVHLAHKLLSRLLTLEFVNSRSYLVTVFNRMLKLYDNYTIMVIYTS